MELSRKSHWIDVYQKHGALWLHNGNPKQPHALLTSGQHSNGFFNSGLVSEDPALLIEASFDLARAVAEEINIDLLTYVVGPALGAVTLAHCVASAFQRWTRELCKSSFTEKVEHSDGTTSMVLKRSTLKEGEDEVLVVEDVLTTGGSAEKTIEAVSHAGGHAAPVVAVLVNRSGLTHVRGGRKIVALIDHPMPMWMASECPLCKQGSEAIRPKGAENWARLNVRY
jgi:orotate phosphoribosyltransferase